MSAVCSDGALSSRLEASERRDSCMTRLVDQAATACSTPSTWTVANASMKEFEFRPRLDREARKARRVVRRAAQLGLEPGPNEVNLLLGLSAAEPIADTQPPSHLQGIPIISISAASHIASIAPSSPQSEEPTDQVNNGPAAISQASAELLEAAHEKHSYTSEWSHTSCGSEDSQGSTASVLESAHEEHGHTHGWSCGVVECSLPWGHTGTCLLASLDGRPKPKLSTGIITAGEDKLSALHGDTIISHGHTCTRLDLIMDLIASWLQGRCSMFGG